MNRCLTISEEIFINQFVQGIHNLENMNDWFQSYDLSNKRAIMLNLFNMVLQSHPTYDDIEHSALQLHKIKSSSAIMLLDENKPFNKFGYRICDLPENELLNGFGILLLTLSKADNRRKKTENSSECNHWWHKDLSNQRYLQEIIERYKNTENTRLE